MPSDDLYLASPSTHTVPCSPYITYHMVSSSPAHVPDVDQLFTSNSRNRRTHITTNQRPGSSHRPVISHLPCGTPPQLTRIKPESKLPNNNLTSVQKCSTPTTNSSQTEQVVPNCSPLTSSQVDSEDSQSQSVPLSSHQCSDRDTLEKTNSRFVPFDEKPAATPEAKRQKRTLNSVPSPNVKHLNMFLNEKIFD